MQEETRDFVNAVQQRADSYALGWCLSLAKFTSKTRKHPGGYGKTTGVGFTQYNPALLEGNYCDVTSFGQRTRKDKKTYEEQIHTRS